MSISSIRTRRGRAKSKSSAAGTPDAAVDAATASNASAKPRLSSFRRWTSASPSLTRPRLYRRRSAANSAGISGKGRIAGVCVRYTCTSSVTSDAGSAVRASHRSKVSPRIPCSNSAASSTYVSCEGRRYR